MIKQNEGTVDRVVRVAIGVIALGLGFFALSGALQIVAIVVGILALATGILGFCGLYALLGINTCSIKKQ